MDESGMDGRIDDCRIWMNALLVACCCCYVLWYLFFKVVG